MKKISIVLVMISLFQFSVISVQASVGNVLKQTGGVFTGVLVSPIVGGFRGAVKCARLGTDYVAKGLGNKDSSFARGVGYLTGGVVGACGCGVAGIVKGGYDGIKYGIDKPFTKENYSLTGNGITDYNVLD